MNLLGFGKQSLPSVIKDPFDKKKITYIRVSVRRNISHPYDFSASGSVEFKNGNTSGEQSFDGENFDDVVMQIKAMLDNF